MENFRPGAVHHVSNSMAFGLMTIMDESEEGIVLKMSGRAHALHITKNDMDQWQQLLDRNAPLQERLKLAALDSYIKTAIKKIGGN